MRIFPCSYCGTPVEFPDHVTHAVCRYCGAQHSLAQPQEGPSANTYMKSAFLFLEDGSFPQAESFFRQAQSLEPENPQVYLGLLLAELHLRKEADLASLPKPFDALSNYKNALYYGDEALKARLTGYITAIREKNQQERNTYLYTRAVSVMEAAQTEEAFHNAAELFALIESYQDSAQRKAQCLERAEQLRLQSIENMYAQIYATATGLMAQAQTPQAYHAAGVQFSRIPNYRDASQKARECAQQAQYLQAAAQAAAQPAPAMPPLVPQPVPAAPVAAQPEAPAVLEKPAQTKKPKKRKGIILVAVLLTVLIAAGVGLWFGYFQPMLQQQAIHQRINEAMVMMEQGEYAEAYAILEELGETEMIRQNKLQRAEALLAQGKYEEAYGLFIEAEDHDSVKSHKRQRAKEHLDLGEYEEAYALYGETGDLQAITDSKRQRAEDYLQTQDYENARLLFAEIEDQDGLDRAYQAEAELLLAQGMLDDAYLQLSMIHNPDYRSDTVRTNFSNLLTIYERQKAYDLLLLTAELLPWAECQSLWTYFSPYQVMDAGNYNLAFIYEDGTGAVIQTDDYGQTSTYTDPGWTDLVSVACGYQFAIGLRADGTVVGYFQDPSSSSSTYDIQQKIRDWTGVVAVRASKNYAVALRYDGSVMLASNSVAYLDLEEVNQWMGLAAVDVGESHAIGLKPDGTLIRAGDHTNGKCNVTNWKDVVAISVFDERTAAIKADGTVLEVGKYTGSTSASRKWTNISYISTGYWHIIAITEDGELLGASKDPVSYGELSFYGWENIVYAVSGRVFTVGLRADGTLVSAGLNTNDLFDLSSISGVRVP